MHGRYEKGHRIRDDPETPQEYLQYDRVVDTGQGVGPIDFAPKYGITSDIPHTLNGSASVLKRTKYGSAPSGSVGSSDASTPATTAAAWPAESSQRSISAKYTPLPVESGFCAEIFRMRIRATFPSNSNHHTVTQREAAQADRESHRQAREKPKAQRFAKICPHASAMQGMIEP